MAPIYLQIAITTTLLLMTTAIRNDDTVTDVLGEPLKPGQSYYLVPTTYSALSGGVTWARFPSSPDFCPEFFITQTQNSLDFGQPITLHPYSKKASEISLSSQLHIEFPNFPSYDDGIMCLRMYYKVWGMSPFNDNYIAIVEGDTLFTIEDDPKGNYNIKFCSGKRGNKVCGALGIVQDVYGGVALGYNVTGKPISFAFEPSYWYSSMKKGSSLASN